MRKFLLLFVAISSLSYASNSRIYIDSEDLDDSKNAFHIHTGHNEWLQTNTVHRDQTGLYTLESDICTISDMQSIYKQQWKCPYCYTYYDVGVACNNKDCPSKYKP
jgi:hypothetical protein